MNPNILKLYSIALKQEKHIIGLMSGTSLDGLDIALCKIIGSGIDTEVELVAFETIDYHEDTKNKIRQVFAKTEVDFPYLVMLNEWLGNLHGDMILAFLQKNKISHHLVDIIASHGQTVMHVPKHQHQNPEFTNATLQIGDGDHIATKTKLITISDFRQKHVAAGGEGAPLAAYGDYLIFSKKGRNRIMLNLGGIANFTYLPADGLPQNIFVTDTGPGNTLMDMWAKNYFDLPYDKDGKIASSGSVNDSLLNQLEDHAFFAGSFPKTTGPELFNEQFVLSAIKAINQDNLSNEDVMATLNQFSAITLVKAILKTVGNSPSDVFISGGGMHNTKLVSTIKSLLPHCHIDNSDILGIPGDAKEAVLFALLANETLSGEAIHFGERNKIPAICMGKISFPF